MKYHKKLKRTDLLKYSWKQILMMAASEFSRADSLCSGLGASKSKELDNCLLRAKELIGVLEIDPTISQSSALVLLTMIKALSNPDPKTLYLQAMQLAA